MKLRITVRNNEVMPANVEEYLAGKIEHLEHLSNQKPLSVEAVFLSERHLKICEILFQLKGKDIFARGEGDDFLKAVDDVTHKVKTQMEKYFKKKIDVKRRAK